MKLKLTQDAQKDLIRIRQYTKTEWGTDQSKKYLLGLRSLFKKLINSPKIGALRPDINTSIRSIPYTRHMIYYLIENDTIFIYAVLHESMIPLNHLNKRLT